MRTFITLIILLFLSNIALAQPGAILFPSPTFITVLNPNGDNWTTTTGAPFIANDDLESEITWTAAFQFEPEPSGDNATGGPCATIDIQDVPVPIGTEKAAYFTVVDPDATPQTGDEFFLFRLRIGKDPGTANFGFSVFIDTDLSFGDNGPCVDDGEAIVGNLGFEIEIRVKNGGGGKGVYLDDVNGLTTGINRVFYSLNSNTQITEALFGNACAKPVFYDFFIPIADLTTWFGIDETDLVRMAFMTTPNGATALGNSASDVGGIDDRNYPSNDSSLVDLICAQSPTALPVSLVNFTAEIDNTAVILKWSTSAEINNDFFTIQRSQNAFDFEDINHINGAGNSSVINNYETIDLSPFYGTSYYRLKQTDYNGKSEHVGLLAVNLEKNDDGICVLEVYPNPCVASCTIDLKDCPLDDSQVDVELYDALGKKIVNRITPKSKDQDISFHLNSSNNLAPGVYIVRSTTNGKNQSKRVLVQ